jgi:hypothetical protein
VKFIARFNKVDRAHRITRHRNIGRKNIHTRISTQEYWKQEGHWTAGARLRDWYEIGDNKRFDQIVGISEEGTAKIKRAHKDKPFRDNLHESGYGIIFTRHNAGPPAAKFPYR